MSPTAADTLLVKEEMAHPVQDAASIGCGVLIRGVFVVDNSAALGGGNTVSGMDEANLRIRWRYASMVLLAWSRTSFSLSIRQGHNAGNIRSAQSSSLKASEVTANAINPAFLA